MSLPSTNHSAFKLPNGGSTSSPSQPQPPQNMPSFVPVLSNVESAPRRSTAASQHNSTILDVAAPRQPTRYRMFNNGSGNVCLPPTVPAKFRQTNANNALNVISHPFATNVGRNNQQYNATTALQSSALPTSGNAADMAALIAAQQALMIQQQQQQRLNTAAAMNAGFLSENHLAAASLLLNSARSSDQVKQRKSCEYMVL